MKQRIYAITAAVFIAAFVLTIGYSYAVAWCWQRTDRSFGRGDYETTKRCLDALTWLEPSNPEPYIFKGWLEWSEAYLSKKGGHPYERKLARAHGTLKNGQRHSPKAWRIYFEEGLMWEAFGEDEKCLQAYYQASRYSQAPYSNIYMRKKANLEKRSARQGVRREM